MDKERIVRLSPPRGALILPADADIYDLDCGCGQVRIVPQDDDLVLTFSQGQIILKGYYARPRRPSFIISGDFLAKRARSPWQRVQPGIYCRNAGGCAEYQIRQMVGGKRFTDSPGAISLEDAVRLREQLKINRQTSAGPQSWSDMERRRAAQANRVWTIGEFRQDKYLPHRRNLERSEADSRLMAGRWKNHLEAWFGAKKFEELTATDFEEYAAWMRGRHAFGETTILHCLADLRKIWAYALKLKAAKQPFPGADAIREICRVLDNEKKCSLEPDEAKRLLAIARERRFRSRADHDVWCYIVLGLGLGLRAGEISRLTRQEIERHIIANTKNRHSRFVHFEFGPVRAMLAERLRIYPPQSPDEPLFRTFAKNAARAVRHAAPKKYYKLIAELGFNQTARRKGNRLEKIDFHALRHTFATFAAMAGVSHLDLMRLMGHRTPAMTLRYVQMTDARQAKCQEMAMAGIFTGESQEFSAGFPA